MVYSIWVTQDERYWSKVEKRGSDECWNWLGGKHSKGYGVFYVVDNSKANGMRGEKAHRYAYILAHGSISDKKVVDHKCFNRICVNPNHLQLLTSVQNSLRMNRVPITHCKRGHEFTLENTAYHSKTKARVCKTCMRKYKKQWIRAYRKRKI